MRWAVMLTTAPRSTDQLTATVASLMQAGWKQELYVYAEPGSTISDVVEKSCKVTVWPERKGVVGNFFAGLESLLSVPADAYLTCQDDVVFAEGLRSYLQRTFQHRPFAKAFEMYSLYVSPALYRQRLKGQPLGWYALRDRNPLAGALTWAVSPSVAARMLTFGRTLVVTPESQHIDSIIGQWIVRDGGCVNFPHPSLVDHTGELCSTLYPPEQGRHAVEFSRRI